MTCSSAVRRGMRLYHWNMKPIFFPRNSASSLSVSFAVSWSSRKYVPVVGRSRSQMIFMRVDLPLPEGHMMATNSPDSIVRLTFLSTRTSSIHVAYVFVTFVIFTIISFKSLEGHPHQMYFFSWWISSICYSLLLMNHLIS